jgi:hypothetical protein
MKLCDRRDATSVNDALVRAATGALPRSLALNRRMKQRDGPLRGGDAH